MPPMVPWGTPYGPQMQYSQMQYMPPGVPSPSPLPQYNQSPVSQPSENLRENAGTGELQYSSVLESMKVCGVETSLICVVLHLSEWSAVVALLSIWCYSLVII